MAALSVLEEPFVLAGDGALRYAEVFGTLGAATIASDELANPPVGVLARLGLECLRAGGGTDAAEISPRYLREADTRINWEQRLPQREPSRTGT